MCICVLAELGKNKASMYTCTTGGIGWWRLDACNYEQGTVPLTSFHPSHPSARIVWQQSLSDPYLVQRQTTLVPRGLSLLY